MTIEYARRRGFPVALFRPLVIPMRDGSTRMEAEYVGKYLKTANIRKIVLVTSNYHTRRAAWLFRHVNPWLAINVVPAPDPFFSPDNWWQSRAGKKTFLLEWLKTFATYLGQ